MRDKAQRRIRHVAKMKTGGVIRSEKLGQTMRVSGSSSERILADKNNTKDEKLIELAAHLIGEIIADHKLSDNDILKVYRKLNQFIESFDNE